MATFAALTGQKLSADAGPDSFNILPALLGETGGKPCRDHLVEHGNTLALRQGTWKFISAAGGNRKAGKAGRAGAEGQLFNLAEDLGETTNVADKNPDRVREMSALLERLQQNGRSRP